MAKQMGSDYYQLMHEIQAADFVLVELTLYLDTHPGDRQALQQFQQFSDYSRKLKKRYEKEFGALLQFGVSNNPGDTWKWSQGPWPWQV